MHALTGGGILEHGDRHLSALPDFWAAITNRTRVWREHALEARSIGLLRCRRLEYE